MPFRLALSILSGVLFALAFPNHSHGYLAFIAFAPLLIAVVRARTTREAFGLGWLAQTTAWLIMVPWVVRAMTYYGGLPYAVGIALLLAMALILGMYGALFALIVTRLKLGVRFAPWLLVPLTWAALEYLRTYFLTGFPWNLLATTLIDYPSFIQIDRFAGPYLVAALILVPSTVAAWWITQTPLPIARVLVGGALGILMLVWWGTGLVASKLNARPTGAELATAALLQPNIAQQMRWDPENAILIFRKMVTMTEQAAKNGAQIVIWPESTVPLSYTEDDAFRESIEALSKRYDIDIILGSVATDPSRVGRIWNSAFLVSKGRTVGHYDKIRLVPFGEYVPLRRVLFFAEKLVHAVGEFEFGTNDRPLVGKRSYGPAICYEVVYPQIARTQVRNGADVIVTITNDGWYDGTSAPPQHLQQARLRAIETDRYMLRAATTGISAFIDPTGRILSSVPMGKDGTIYAKFQARTTITPYVRFGDWFAWLASLAVVITLVRTRRRSSPGAQSPA
ncbi:MAG TPA: apolipoprotein N-acyltransferase [Thermoanaerobaculia bacterium]|jgi:apolipoprotein N-acyltransferase